MYIHVYSLCVRLDGGQQYFVCRVSISKWFLGGFVRSLAVVIIVLLLLHMLSFGMLYF